VSAPPPKLVAGSGITMRRRDAHVCEHRVNDGTDVVTSSGIGPQLGIGYEYPVNRSWRLAPFAHYSVGVFGGDVKFNAVRPRAARR